MKLKKVEFNTIKLLLYDSLIIINSLLESMYADIDSVTHILKLLRYGLVAILFCNIFFLRKIDKKKFVFSGIMFFFCLINYFIKNGSIGLMIGICVVFLCISVSLDRIILHTLVSTIMAYSFVIVSSLLGIITNITIVRYLSIGIWQGKYIRQALGFQFPNQIPLMLFYLTAVVFFYLKDKIKIFHVSIFMIANIVIYLICNARSQFILTILIIISFYIYKMNNYERMRKYYLYTRKLICTLPYITTIAMFVGSLILSISYPKIRALQKMDYLFNSRLSSAYLTIKYWGLSLFGSGIEAGTKGTEIRNVFSNSSIVNVDNGYVIFLLQYGILLYICMMIVFLAISKRIYKNGDEFISVVFLLVLFSNYIDANLNSFRMWPIFILFFTCTQRKPIQFINDYVLKNALKE